MTVEAQVHAEGVWRCRWGCSGAPEGPLTAALVPPHCAESSSAASLPCGHTLGGEREREREGGWVGGWGGRTGMRGQTEGESTSDRFWMDRGHVPIIFQPPWEYPDKMKSCLALLAM